MNVVLPKMFPLRQEFPRSAPLQIPAVIRQEMERSGILAALKPNACIAVAVGSRGITNLATIVASVVDTLRERGAAPFIIPAMGSHGGATPEGQTDILRGYGVNEERLGVPLQGAMEVECVGSTPQGVEVFCAREALRADGIIVINRIKPHTDFAGTMGSGVMKMMVIGLGKRAGAAAFHVAAMKHGYEEMLRAASRLIAQKAPVLGGVGIVEDQFHQTAILSVMPKGQIEPVENELFKEAARLMPGLPFDDIDLLIIDQIGKNISGSGMDPNVIGRGVHGYLSRFADMNQKIRIRRIFVRDLTPETHGNGIGIGLADVTTTRLVRGLDHGVTYINALTSLTPNCAKIPIHFDTDREVLTHILPTLGFEDTSRAKVLRIADTLNLEMLEASEAFQEQLAARPPLKAMGPVREMGFSSDDNLLPIQH